MLGFIVRPKNIIYCFFPFSEHCDEFGDHLNINPLCFYNNFKLELQDLFAGTKSINREASKSAKGEVTPKTLNEEKGNMKQFSSEGSDSGKELKRKMDIEEFSSEASNSAKEEVSDGKKRKREEEEEKDQTVQRPLKMKIMRSDSGEFQINN
jgi:hypothetical protein